MKKNHNPINQLVCVLETNYRLYQGDKFKSI